jgi:hypothetical protein
MCWFENYQSAYFDLQNLYKFYTENPKASYITEMVDVISTLQNKPFGTVLAPVASTTSTTLADAKEPGSATNILHTDGSTSEFKSAIKQVTIMFLLIF